MIRDRLLALAERRTRLSVRAQAERDALNSMLAPADAAAALAVSASRLASRLLDQAARYPSFVVAGVVLLAALRPRRAVIWLTRGWSLWRMYRGAQGVWQRFAGSSTDASVRANPPRQAP